MADRVVHLTPEEDALLRKIVGPVPGAAHLFRGVQVREPVDPRVAAILTRPPEVRFLTTQIPPPTAFYLAREDQIRISLWNSVAGVTIFFGARFLGPDGVVVPWTEALTPPATRTESVTVLPPVEGYLLGVYFGTTSTLLPGQCYVSCVVTRPRLPAGSHMHPLVAGYVTTSFHPGWPNTPLRDARDGQGAVRIIVGTQPAAGGDITETVPVNARWRVRAFRAILTNGGIGANRIPRLTLDDGANVYATLNYPTTTGPGAGQVETLVWGAGIGAFLSVFVAARVSNMPLTDTVLAAGSRIRTMTESLQAADQWSAPIYLVEEWIDV